MSRKYAYKYGPTIQETTALTLTDAQNNKDSLGVFYLDLDIFEKDKQRP